MNKKRILLALCVIPFLCLAALIGKPRGNVSHADRVAGYSALYNEAMIHEAFDVIETRFAADFAGCTLLELRYDADVENRFADAIAEHAAKTGQELIIILSAFETDENGGDGGFNPNDTYANWQWHLVRTADKHGWEIISWGY